ncbi:MBOAT family O-acyltransferase [Leptospira ognonensis]
MLSFLPLNVYFVYLVKKLRFNKQIYVVFRAYILLIFSLLFYSSWNPKYLVLMVWVAAFDFSISQWMQEERARKHRKWLLALSLANNLGVLIAFKYLGFFEESLVGLIHLLGMEAHIEILRLVLPVGISFYIFQSISYIVDIYRGILPPERNFFYYLFYLSFFPQLVAGPIVQAKVFLPQIRRMKPISPLNLKMALFLLLLGAFKKSVLADHLAITADFSFSHIMDVDRKFLWLGLLSYTGQIYCDFSGYTDIALGSALIFGFRLPENFRMPYLARGFSDFWRRWHISLSSWLKSYLYIPIGGNRHGGLRTYRNLMIVMLLGGLWHGANWNFIVWGLGHGILLSLEKGIKDLLQMSKYWKVWLEGKWARIFVGIGSWLFTFVSVSLLWIFFRSTKFSDSLCYLQGLFIKNGDISISYTQEMVTIWCLLAIVLGHILGDRYVKRWSKLERDKSRKQTPVRYMFLGALFSLGFIAVVLMSGNSLPFVYFVF